MTDKYVPDKSLRDYTAGEIHDICKGVTNCDRCLFQQADGSCPYYDQTPVLWRVGESVNTKAVTVAPEWISVKDGLPDLSGLYLTVNMDDHYVPSVTVYRKWRGFDEKCVTHWMPLPNAPRREECNDV